MKAGECWLATGLSRYLPLKTQNGGWRETFDFIANGSFGYHPLSSAGPMTGNSNPIPKKRFSLTHGLDPFPVGSTNPQVPLRLSGRDGHE